MCLRHAEPFCVADRPAEMGADHVGASRGVVPPLRLVVAGSAIARTDAASCRFHAICRVDSNPTAGPPPRRPSAGGLLIDDYGSTSHTRTYAGEYEHHVYMNGRAGLTGAQVSCAREASHIPGRSRRRSLEARAAETCQANLRHPRG